MWLIYSSRVLFLLSHYSLFITDFHFFVSFFQHEIELCKNLLQKYAQKMNYVILLYHYEKNEIPGWVPFFKCKVVVDGIKYIGALVKTKKEAKIKPTITALLAIESNAYESSNKPIYITHLTILLCRKRGRRWLMCQMR